MGVSIAQFVSAGYRAAYTLYHHASSRECCGAVPEGGRLPPRTAESIPVRVPMTADTNARRRTALQCYERQLKEGDDGGNRRARPTPGSGARTCSRGDRGRCGRRQTSPDETYREMERRTGVSDAGMEFEVLGDGLRTLLFIPGGPGSEVPTGLMAKMMSSQFTPYVRAGFTVWHVTRRRNMPQGYSIADMADDYAAFVAAEMGGTVDLVVGESFGGLVAQYLAANHPTLVHRVVLAVSAGAITDSGKDLDRRWASARAEGRFADAGEVFLEYVLPGADRAALRRRLGPLAGRLFANSSVPAEDLLVEAEAEAGVHARGILSGIQVPVLIVCGDQDEFFSREIVEETAELIPDSTLVWNAGMGHVRAAMDPGTPRAVLEWAGAGGTGSV